MTHAVSECVIVRGIIPNLSRVCQQRSTFRVVLRIKNAISESNLSNRTVEDGIVVKLYLSIAGLLIIISAGYTYENMQTLDGKHSAGHWSGRFGFLMAAVGSAVGLGNIWRFPYLAGAQGGALFLIAYVVLILVVGFSLMIAEFAIGRSAAKNVVDAFGARKKGWGVVGVIGCVASFVIVSYYCVIGGWIMRYAAGYFDGGSFVAGGDYAEVFASFTGNSWEPVVCMLVFMAVCLVIILMGVKTV